MLGVFLDTETNGLDWSIHSILEIALIIINLRTGEKIASYESMLQIESDAWKKGDINSLHYTNITKDALEKYGQTKKVVKEELLVLFEEYKIIRGKAVFICQNPGFDRAFFNSLIEVEVQEKNRLPYHWLDLASMYWTKRVINKSISNDFSLSKDAIAKYYNLEGEKTPHRAMQGAIHLTTCYNSVVGFPEKDSQ